MVKKAIPLIILIALVIVGARLCSRPKDTWKQNKDGTWVRIGNPKLPIPEHIVKDCYQQNNTRAFDIAYILCREDLCGSDRACARFLETAFEKINISRAPQTAANSNTPTSDTEPQPNQNSEPNTNPERAVPTTTPTSTALIAIREQTSTDTNTNTAIPELSKPVTQPITQTPTESQELPNTNPNITIETPASGTSITSPIVIMGRVKAVAGEPINIQITTKSGTVLINETAKLKASGPDGWGLYKITIAYQFSSTREGYIVVSHGEDTASVAVTFE